MNNQEKKNITIADVADALGVSRTTVSRAISGKGRIGKETRERVMEYIESILYLLFCEMCIFLTTICHQGNQTFA